MYAFEAGKRAIEAHLERTGTKGEVSHTQDLGFYRVKYPVQGKPLVSVIIPNKDEKETLQTCLEMLEKNTGYQNFEIISWRITVPLMRFSDIIKSFPETVRSIF